MAINAGTAQGSLTLNASDFFKAIQSAITELQNLKNESDKASGSVKGFGNDLIGIGSNLKSFGDKVAGVGKSLSKYVTAPLVGIGVYSVKTSMNFEKAMSQVQATMGATKEDMVELEAAAKHMGETTQFTNTEAAQALNYLALAGYNSEQMIAALPSVLNLAAAGGMDLADASDMLTDGLSALNLASEDSEELMTNMTTMVDQMAKTASSSNTSVAQLGDSILTVGGTATYLSGGLTEVNQVIGLLADRGIKASEAGTHLRNIILAMQPATDAARQAFVKVGLGIEDAEGNFTNLAYDAEGSMKPLSEIFEALNEGMKTMSDMEKQQVLADIFHRTDLASANALLGTSQERWKELGSAIENATGSGAQMAETQLDNLSGQMTLLKSKIEGLATTIGELLAPIIADIVDSIGEWVDKFAELDPETQNFIVKAGIIAAVLGPILGVFGKLISGTGMVIRAFGMLFNTLVPIVKNGVSALLSPATLGLGSVLAGIGAFIAGYGIGTMIYDAIGPEIDEILHPIFDKFVEIWDAICSFFTESIPGFFSEVWDNVSNFMLSVKETITGAAILIWESIKAVWSGVVNFFSDIWNGIKSVFSAVGSWFVSVFTSAWNGIKAAWSGVKSFFKGLWDGITSTFSSIGSWFKNLFAGAWEGIKFAWSKVVDFFSGIWDGIKNVFSSVGSWFKNVFSGAWEGIKSVFSSVGNFFSRVWDSIKNAFSAVGNWFKSIFSGAWEGIKSVFSGVKDFFVGIWETIKGAFSFVGEKIADVFSTAFKAAFNSVMTVVEGIVNFFIDAVNGVIWALNLIPFVDIDPFDNVEFTRLSVGLDYVPYDDYQAMLHKGERVLTKEENEEYTNGGKSGNGDTYIFNSPNPIDEVEAARQIKRVKQELAEGF